MITVREFISGIKRDYAPDVDTTDLVRYLDRLQRQVFLQSDNSKRIWLNTIDPVFPYPSLVTVDGQRTYEIGDMSLVDSQGNPIVIQSPTGAPEEVQSILNVFAFSGALLRDNYTTNFTVTGGYNSMGFNGAPDSFVKIPCVLTDRVGDNPPTVQFGVNPGDSNQGIYVEFTTAPMRIDSINSPCAIDLSTFETQMTDGMVGLIERVRNGESVSWQKWEDQWLVDIRDYYNRNDDNFYDLTIGHNY